MTDDTTDQLLTSLQRRLIDAAADIMETQADSPEFLHSVLCQVAKSVCPALKPTPAVFSVAAEPQLSRSPPDNFTGAESSYRLPCHTAQNLVWC